MKVTKFPHFISADDFSLDKHSGVIGTFYAAIGGIILNDKNQVLLTQRSQTNEKNPGVWEILFGRVDQGEGFEKALAREAMEELGIKIKPQKIIATMHYMRLPHEPEHIGIIYLCRFIEGQEIKPQPKEIAAWQWTDLDQAIDIVIDYVKPHLKYILSSEIKTKR